MSGLVTTVREGTHFLSTFITYLLVHIHIQKRNVLAAILLSSFERPVYKVVQYYFSTGREICIGQDLLLAIWRLPDLLASMYINKANLVAHFALVQ